MLFLISLPGMRLTNSLPDEAHQPDTIFRNLRLIATPWNFFTFVIVPLIASLWTLFTVIYCNEDMLGRAWAVRCFVFALAVLPTVVICIAIDTTERIRKKLEAAGYVRQRTRAREVDFAINFLIFGAFMYWMKSYENVEAAKQPSGTFLAIVAPIMIWWLMVMVSIGPVLWFTVRARRGEENRP